MRAHIYCSHSKVLGTESGVGGPTIAESLPTHPTPTTHNAPGFGEPDLKRHLHGINTTPVSYPD